MREIFLALPKLMEGLLGHLENEELNASGDKHKEEATKKVIAELKGLTSQLTKITEAHDQVSQETLFKMLGNLQGLQGMMPEVNPENLEKIKEMSPEIGSLLEMKDVISALPQPEQLNRVLSPIEQVKEIQSLKEDKKVEKSTDTQSETNRVDPTEDKD